MLVRYYSFNDRAIKCLVYQHVAVRVYIGWVKQNRNIKDEIAT